MPKVEEDFEPQHIRLAKTQLTRINDWRRQQPDLPSKAEAIRRLINMALTLEATMPKRRRPKPDE